MIGLTSTLIGFIISLFSFTALGFRPVSGPLIDGWNKKKLSEFSKEASAVVLPYFDSLREDIKHFCKKFDYRYTDVPWGNAKDSPERAVKFLCSDIHTGKK